MTPYLAIIKDSFREALASRVLWVVIVLITLLLVAFIPFTWVGTIGASIDATDIHRARNLASDLKVGSESDASPLQKKLWNSLSDKTQEFIDKLSKGEPGPHIFAIRELLARDLNKLVEDPDFYDPSMFEDVEKSERLSELLAKSNLSPELAMQRNRLALEAALPGQLRVCPEEAMMFRYAKWDLEFIPPMTRPDAEEGINMLLLIVIPLFVGFFGIFAAILVTAPIIPNMLSSGSLYVLLSKPISRTWLFLAKFFGGCSFVLINVLYLIIGAILILGIRFQLWKPELLWVIPIFLFSFSIFYSVSAVAGLVWRSAVLSIAMTVLFWFICSSVGGTRGAMDLLIINPQKIQKMAPSGDQLFIQRRNGSLAVWDKPNRSLVSIMKSKGRPDMMMARPNRDAGMYYDDANEIFVKMERDWSQVNIVAGKKSNDWKREPPIPAPKGAIRLFSRNSLPTVVADDGIYEVSLAGPEEESVGDVNIFGIIKIPAPTKKEQHKKVSTDLGRISSNALVAYSATDDRIYIQNGRTLQALEVVDSLFEEVANIRLEDEVIRLVAGNGHAVLLTRNDDGESLEVFNGDLTRKFDVDIQGEKEVETIALSSNGQWVAAVNEADKLTLFDLSDNGQSRPVSGEYAAATFSGEQLMTADMNDRIVTWEASSLSKQQTIAPQQDLPTRLYRYLINPVYLLFPKPSELQNTMLYALTGKNTQKIEGPMGGNQTIKFDPWQPVYSNSIFIGVMLLLGCVYIYRQDF